MEEAKTEWHRAACRNTDPELFFPVGTSGLSVMQAELAVAICAVCPIKEPCLEQAPEYGVWGGHTEQERRAMSRRQRRTHANHSPDGGHDSSSRLVEGGAKAR